MRDQAFPRLDSLRYKTPSELVASTVGGLTKRELFAAMAMQGLLSNPNAIKSKADADALEEAAVNAADALIAALSKEPKP